MLNNTFNAGGLDDKGLHNILVVEDSDRLRVSLIQEMTRVFNRSVVIGATSIELAMNLIQSRNFDVVTINPGINGHAPCAGTERIDIVSQLINFSPDPVYLVIADMQSLPEAIAMENVGAQGYLSASGLYRDELRIVLDEISRGNFAVRLHSPSKHAADLHFSELTKREQDVLIRARGRVHGTTLRDLYKQMSIEYGGVDPETIKRYYMQARCKLLRVGIQPIDNTTAD